MGGFSSLRGDFDFWDLTSAQLRKLGSANAFSSAFHAWSPDGRYFIACILSPRIRIDNGVKYFDYYGQFIHEISIPELYDVLWAPLPAAAVNPLRSRPLSPRRAVAKATASASTSPALAAAAAAAAAAGPAAGAATAAAAAAAAAKTAATAPVAAKPAGVYRHPNWKGSETSISAPVPLAASPPLS